VLECVDGLCCGVLLGCAGGCVCGYAGVLLGCISVFLGGVDACCDELPWDVLMGCADVCCSGMLWRGLLGCLVVCCRAVLVCWCVVGL
jgi:hypothetical protein